jgi:hypothetical protein
MRRIICRGQSEELGSVLPADVLNVYQTKVDLIDQGGGLECIARPLIPHVASRHAAQLVVHFDRQQVQRGLIAAAPSP